MHTPLIGFYSGIGTDNQGRTLEEIWSWDDNHLERIHDYIQWMFPLSDHSAYNPNAPVLNQDEIREFQGNHHLQANMCKSFTRILKFYGFVLNEDNNSITITKADNFEYKSANWLNMHDHNHLRITRILKSLCLTGLYDHAEAFLQTLEEVYQDHPSIIGEKTLGYWRSALQ